MGWSWFEYRTTPIDVINEAIGMMRDQHDRAEAERRQAEQQRATRRR